MEIDGQNPGRERKSEEELKKPSQIQPAKTEKPIDLSNALLPALPEKEKVAPEAVVTKSAVTPEPLKPQEETGKWSPKKFVEPTPHRALMRIMANANEWFMLRGVPILRDIPLLNKIPFIGRGCLKFSNIDLPKEDIQKLKSSINSKTAAFIAPNHPEFSLDAMIDKAVTNRIAPLIACWVDQSIVNLHPFTQKIMLANNLIANVRQGGGKEYSIEWALKGHGVLLHPEGMVGWAGNKVFQIYPGIVDMAVQTALKAEGTGRPVFIAPVVYKYVFDHEVTKGLHKEMKGIEKRLQLPSGEKRSLEERFFELHKNLLLSQEKRFELPAAKSTEPVTSSNYFDRQKQLHDFLRDDLVSRYGNVPGSDHRWIFKMETVVKKAEGVSPEQKKHDDDKLKEMRRLFEFSEELYGTKTLTQEEIAESLKRVKRDLIRDSSREIFRNYFPVAVGQRSACIRAAEPVNVSEALSLAGGDSPEFRVELLKEVHSRMQKRLTELKEELHPSQSRYERPNPFCRNANSPH